VETLRTEKPRMAWAKVAAEVRRLAALAPATCEVETVCWQAMLISVTALWLGG
jgi:hypothetical protein